MRKIVLTKGYFASAPRAVKAGSVNAQKLASEIHSLADANLPTRADRADLIPPVLPCWSRRIEGTPLEILFDFSDTTVRVLFVRLVSGPPPTTGGTPIRKAA